MSVVASFMNSESISSVTGSRQSSTRQVDRSAVERTGTSWTARYGPRHRWQRVDEFPAGIAPPTKVRIYRRRDHFILNWWDPERKSNVSERVDGDLLEAMMRARKIDERLNNFRRTGSTRRKVGHGELVDNYMSYQTRRAETGEIDPATADRYRTALKHYRDFAESVEVQRKWDTPVRVDRDFAMTFQGYLSQLRVAPNGHPNSVPKRITAPGFIENVVRSMYRWAADPERGALLPEGFRSPFAARRRSHSVKPDLFGEPDITLDMAVDFLKACDHFQLPLFSLLVFFGLRPSEPCFAFREHLAAGWLRLVCLPEIDYFTKGRRDKRLPLIEPLRNLLEDTTCQRKEGLLFVRRCVLQGTSTPPYGGRSLEQLARAYDAACADGRPTPKQRRTARTSLLRNAGAMNYDDVEHEFHQIAEQLNWPREATLKDFRHLFNTSMQNAGMPEFYRRYLLGQSFGRSALVNYTHLNDLRQQYERAVGCVYQPLVEVVAQRSHAKRQNTERPDAETDRCVEDASRPSA